MRCARGACGAGGVGAGGTGPVFPGEQEPLLHGVADSKQCRLRQELGRKGRDGEAVQRGHDGQVGGQEGKDQGEVPDPVRVALRSRPCRNTRCRLMRKFTPELRPRAPTTAIRTGPVTAVRTRNAAVSIVEAASDDARNFSSGA